MNASGCLLIVDDEPNNRKTLQALLSPLGYQVAQAADGPEALAQAAQLHPDIVLLDVMMPGMDGFEVCRRLRADPLLADAPIILVTSLDDRESRLAGIEAGADDFVTKPFDRAELRARVQTIMRLNRYRRLLDERARSERLIELSPDGLVVVDGKAHVSVANPAAARLLGLAGPSELVGRSLLDFVPPSTHWTFRERLGQVLAQPGAAERFEMNFANPAGDEFPAEVTLGEFPGQTAASAQVILRDIRHRREAEAAQRLAARVFDSMAEGIVVADAQAKVVAVNPAFAAITGHAAGSVVGWPAQRLYSNHIETAHPIPPLSELNTIGQWQGEIWSRRSTGELFPAGLTLSVVRDEHGQVANYVGVFSDITARKQAEERMRILAYHDPLTGLPNRALFNSLLQQSVAQAQRSGRQGAILFIDLDRFKNVNDTLGHGGGDVLLRDAALRFRSQLRASDVIARLGGDEFVILLEELSQPVDAASVAQKLLRAVAEPFKLAGHEVFVTCSIGISVFPTDAADVDDLFKNADTALYRAKEQGRNNYMFYTADMYAAALKRMTLENSLRRALERDEFRVYYQPRIELSTGRVGAVEALLRWRHPELGMVPPGQFIAVAEETGLIVPIGEWVLREACRQVNAWHMSGFPRLRLSVNLSGRQFRQPQVVGTIASALSASGLAPEDLELELTESILFLDSSDTLEKLNQLRDMGVHLAIDDFGTGYSSLDYLKRLPVNRLKIDRSFVRGVATQSDDGAIVRAIIAMAHSLDLTVTAEGVETAEQLSFLQVSRCDETQGFYFGQPVPPEEFTRFL